MIRTVILPARNRRDLEKFPADARDSSSSYGSSGVDDALATALSPLVGRRSSLQEDLALAAAWRNAVSCELSGFAQISRVLLRSMRRRVTE